MRREERGRKNFFSSYYLSPTLSPLFSNFFFYIKIEGNHMRTEKQIREKIEEIQYAFGDAFDFEVPKEKRIIFKTLKWVLEEIDDLN